MERLKLDFRQIKKLYDFKIRTIKTEEKYMKLAKNIIVHELISLSYAVRSLGVNLGLIINIMYRIMDLQ